MAFHDRAKCSVLCDDFHMQANGTRAPFLIKIKPRMPKLRNSQKQARAAPRRARRSARIKTKPANPLIRCVIFDLDDTLYDCFRQRVRGSHRHAARAMVKAGLRATVEAVYRARMSAFREDPMLRYIDAEVCRRFQSADPEAVSRAAREAYFNFPVRRLRLFPGTLPLLRFLARQGVRIFVVSFGEPKTQQAKAKSLGLERNPLIERIFYADRGKLLTKEAAFRQIQSETRIDASEILVVGDRPMSEIRAGNELGMHTVRIHRGEFAIQEPQGLEEHADHVVKNISEVRKLPFRWRS